MTLTETWNDAVLSESWQYLEKLRFMRKLSRLFWTIQYHIDIEYILVNDSQYFSIGLQVHLHKSEENFVDVNVLEIMMQSNCKEHNILRYIFVL